MFIERLFNFLGDRSNLSAIGVRSAPGRRATDSAHHL